MDIFLDDGLCRNRLGTPCPIGLLETPYPLALRG